MLHLRIWTQLGPPTMGQISVPDGVAFPSCQVGVVTMESWVPRSVENFRDQQSNGR